MLVFNSPSTKRKRHPVMPANKNRFVVDNAVNERRKDKDPTVIINQSGSDGRAGGRVPMPIH